MLRFHPLSFAGNLIFGCAGCSLVPLYSSSSDAIISKGGNYKYENMYLLLAGTDFKNGIAVEFPLKEQNGGGHQFQNLNKVTWWGQTWNSNWTLISERGNREYTLISGQKYEGASCLFANYWNRNKVCTRNGKPQSAYEDVWATFPKVKFIGDWRAQLRGQGYSHGASSSNLKSCKVSIVPKQTNSQELLKFHWTATITCDKSIFTKELTENNIVVGRKIRV